MRNTVLLICALLICSAIYLSCSGDQTKSALLTGRVTATDTSVNLAGVKVYEQSHAQLSTVTDSMGYFELDGVMFEEHNIYFEKEGYQPYTLWFEYTGTLQHPILSRQVILKKIGETEPVEQTGDAEQEETTE